MSDHTGYAVCFGATAGLIQFPTDGKGGTVTTAAAGATSAGATSTFTETTATDSAKDPSATPAAPNGLVAGCLIVTQDGFYSIVESFTAGIGGAIRVRGWLHADPAKHGQKPADGQTFTVYTQPLPSTGTKKCHMGRAASVVLETLEAPECITATHYCQLTDAAGNLLMPNGAAKGYQFRSTVGDHYRIGTNGKRIHGIVGFKLDHATDLTIEAVYRIDQWGKFFQTGRVS